MEQRSSPSRLGNAMNSGNKPRTIARDVSQSLGKLPPQALDLEESVLGAILLEAKAIERVIKILKPEHFYSDNHREIYQAICDLHYASEPNEMRMVVARLKKNGKLEVAGGAFYIAELQSKISRADNVEFHARIILEAAIKRDLIQIASQIHHEAYEDTTDVFDLLEQAQSSIKVIHDQNLDSPYVPIDMPAAGAEHGTDVQGGDSARIDELKNVFAWMRGFVNGWYGWSNDGKGTMFDFLSVLKTKRDGWKWCMYKPEDMDTVIDDAKNVKIKANRIYKNLAWTLTGKTWSASFAKKHNLEAMSFKEEMEALEFIGKHVFIVNPRDRSLKSLLNCFQREYDKHGIDGFLIDPWNTVDVPSKRRDDIDLVNAFIDIKEFSMLTNSSVNIIAHPKSIVDVKVSKDQNSAFKTVNQFMILGGAAWDMKMDGQYSIYRPERHLNHSDPKVHFLNIKQRQAEIVGVERGEYTKILFDKFRKQYYFDGVNPMDGSQKFKKEQSNPTIDFTQSSKPGDDEPPF